MKGRSCAIEFNIEITNEELLKLKDGRLEGLLRFEDFFSEPNIDRQIPISISRVDDYLRDFISINSTPKKGYLGLADRIDFEIDREYYNELLERGEYGARFWGSGKLIIKVQDSPHKTL